MTSMTRRGILAATGIIIASPFWSWAQAVAQADAAPRKRLLFFTKSQDYSHPLVTRTKAPDGKPSEELAIAEKILKQWTEAAGYEIVITKEGSIFTPETIATFDTFIFHTSGDLTKPPARGADLTSAMSPEGKAALLKAIEEGKGFLGVHSATATFNDTTRKSDPVALLADGEKVDSYIRMLGAQFTSHGDQQKATIRIPPTAKDFPGLAYLKQFDMTEEWYAFTAMARDLHVLMIQDTASMSFRGQRQKQYTGPNYPNTWARLHGKGRVFNTSLGHREDVWNNPLYQPLLLAALAWTTRRVDAEIKPNILELCPELK